MKMTFKTLKITTNPNVQGSLIFKRHYISLLQGPVQRITRVNFDWKIRLAMSVQENKRDRTRRTRHLGNRVVALWLMSLAQGWSLLQKWAALQADGATLHKQQAIQQEESRLRQEIFRPQQLQEEAKFRLDQRKGELNLERKIARAQAEDQTYANAKLEIATGKQPSGISAQVLPLPLHGQPMKPHRHMAPQETKPLESKHYDDVHLAGPLVT